MASWSDWFLHPYQSAAEAVGLASPEPHVWTEEEIAQLTPEQQDRILGERAPDPSVYLGASLLDRLPGMNVGGYLTDPRKDAANDPVVQLGAGTVGVVGGAVGETAVRATEGIKAATSGPIKLAIGLGILYAGSQLLRRGR